MGKVINDGQMLGALGENFIRDVATQTTELAPHIYPPKGCES